jgi:hypothetical protein
MSARVVYYDADAHQHASLKNDIHQPLPVGRGLMHGLVKQDDSRDVLLQVRRGEEQLGGTRRTS